MHRIPVSSKNCLRSWLDKLNTNGSRLKLLYSCARRRSKCGVFRGALLSLFALWAAAVESAPLPSSRADALREQFKARQQRTSTWSANFTQTLVMPGMQHAVVSKGTLLYRAPSHLRLDFTKPQGEFVLVVGDQLFLKKTGRNVERKSLSGDLAGKPFQSLIGMLRGQPTEDESRYVPEVSSREGKFVVVLNRKPDAPDELPNRITTILNENSLDVREVFVELPNGGVLQYGFDAVMRNRAIDGTRFLPPTSR